MVLLGLAGWFLFTGAASGATRNGMIAFVRNGDLHVMNPDGTGDRRLFSTSGENSAYPRFSPDGDSLLWSDGNTDDPRGDIVVASLAFDDGVRRVGTGLAAWSPDSKRIAYAAYQAADDTVDIHVVGAGGTNDRLVKVEPDPCLVGEFSAGIWWSRATDRIMYVCRGKVVSIEPDGSGRRIDTPLARRNLGDGSFVNLADVELSFDGTRFAGRFLEDVSTWNWRTGAITDATSDKDASDETWLRWSPDDSRLLFADRRTDGPGGLATAGLNGGKALLSGGRGEVYHPAWQPCVDGETATCKPVTLDATRVPPLDRWDALPTLGADAARQTGAAALSLKVGCSGRSSQACDVTVTAQTAKAVATAARKRKLIVARGSAKIAPGKVKTVKLELRRPARRALARAGKLALRVTAAAERSDGVKRRATTKLTMRARPRR
jgi:hypothetical protein